MNTVAIILDDLESAYGIIEKINDESVLFELRIDLDPHLVDLLNGGIIDRNRCIITYRSKEEGGNGRGEYRAQFIEAISKHNCRYLDIEISRDEPPKTNSQIVYSIHEYRMSMEAAAKLFIYRHPKVDGICKFVGKPYDTLDFIKAYKMLTTEYEDHVILGIGKNAEISRTSYPQEFVFGSTVDGPIMHYKSLLALDKNSLKLGLIGKKVDYSLSPTLHHKFLDLVDKSGHYHLLEADTDIRLMELFGELRDIGFLGLNITQPYKHDVLEMVDQVTEAVVQSNSVNTIKIGSKIRATNTDTSGFTTFMKNHQLDRYENATIIGAGGAGRSVAISLLGMDIEVTMINRDTDRFSQLPVSLRDQIETDVIKNKIESDIVINATTSSINNSLPFPSAMNVNTAVAIDLFYSKNMTLFNKFIKDSNPNLLYFDGLEMLYYQALHAFKYWTGSDIEPLFIREEIL